jgi:hypothetical protein
MSGLVKTAALLFALLSQDQKPCRKVKHSSPQRKEIIAMQREVNEGHRPTQLQAQTVATIALRELRNDPLLSESSINEESLTNRFAVYSVSGNDGKTYRVTLQRFKWLLPIAKKYEWMIWVPVKSEVLGCTPKTS